MSTPLNPVYCPVCRKENPANLPTCPHCGAKTTSQDRALEALESQRKAAYLAAAEHDHQKRLQAEARADKVKAKAEEKDARRQEIYNRATGRGICPECKSPNVKPYTFTEGDSSAGQSMACCLGCFVSPLAWLVIPLLQGRKKRGMECQYCSHRWRL